MCVGGGDRRFNSELLFCFQVVLRMYSFLPCYAFFQSMQLLVVVIVTHHEFIRNIGRDTDTATDIKEREVLARGRNFTRHWPKLKDLRFWCGESWQVEQLWELEAEELKESEEKEEKAQEILRRVHPYQE